MTSLDILTQKLAQDANQLKQVANNPQQANVMNIARERGNTLATDNDIVNDRANLAPYDFYRKYGDDITTAADTLDLRSNDLRNGALLDRTPTESLTDTAINVTTGLVQPLLGASAWLTSKINEDAGLSAARGTDQIVSGIQSFESLPQKLAKARSSINAELDKVDNAKQFETDLKTDGKLVAELKATGRSAVSAFNRISTDDEAFYTGVTQGVGSMIAGAGFGKAIGTTIEALATATGTSIATSSTANMSAAIGAMEGGGAYQQVVSELMNNPDLTHEKLMGEPRYAAYIEQGYSPEEAKTRTISDAGNMAAYVQAPLAAATGLLVARFEANPFKHTSLMGALQNAGREALEEGTQGFTGAAASNFGKSYADKSQRVFEDAAGQAVEGGILGAASAGLIQAPSMARAGAVTAVKGVVNAAANRLASVNEGIATQSPVSDTRMAEADAAVVPEAVSQAVQTMAPADTDITPVIEKVNKSLRLEPTELDAMSDAAFDVLARNTPEGQPLSRFTATQVMAMRANDTTLTKDERVEAAAFLLDQNRRTQELTKEDLPRYLENADQASPEYTEVSNYSKLLNQANEMPNIKAAMKWAADEAIVTSEPNATVEPAMAQQAATIAEHLPQNVDPQTARQILKQDTAGEVQLTDTQRSALASSIILNNAGQLFNDMTATDAPAAETTTFKPYEVVTEQIESKGGKNPHMLSMTQHVTGINDAMRNGDIGLAEQRMQALNNFAQHMNNKVTAINESLASGLGSPKVRTPFDILRASGKFTRASNEESMWADYNHENSMKLASTIAAQAAALTQLSNNMAQVFPELGGKTLQAPALLTQQAQPVAQQQEAAPKVQPKPEQPKAIQEAPTAVTEPVAKEAVKAEPVQLAMELTQPEPKQVEPVKEAAVVEAVEKPVVVEAPIEEVAAAPAPVDYVNKTFPGLRSNGEHGNKFVSAFKQPKQAKSRLIENENPIEELDYLVNNPAAIVKHLDGNLDYDVTPQNRAGWNGFIQLATGIADLITDTLTKQLHAKIKRTGKSLMDYANDGDPVNRWQNGRLLNVVDENGKLQPKIAQFAGLAAVDTLVNGDKEAYLMDSRAIADSFGIEESAVNSPIQYTDENGQLQTETFADQVNAGISRNDYVNNIARKLTAYLGLDANKNESESYVKGIPLAIASLVVDAMVAEGLITQREVAIPSTVKTFNQIDKNSAPEAVANGLEAIEGSANLLSDLVQVDKVRPMFSLGESIFTPARTVLKNPAIETTRQQREMLDNVQNIPNYVNEPYFNLASEIGNAGMVLFGGGMLFEEGSLNKVDEASKKGKNRTINSSFNNVQRQMSELRSHGKKQNTPISDVPVYYEMGITSVGRMQPLGLSSPVTDKFARQVFMPNRTTLDMTDKVDADRFWMTIGQGLGVKTEKPYRADVVSQAKEIVTSGKLAPAVDTLVEWLNGKPLPKTFINDLITAWDGGQSHHGLDSLLSVARLRDAENKKQDLTNYVYNGYLEADGKTNGPIMALVMYKAGEITRDWLNLVRKGGLYIGEMGRSLNSHINERDSADLYEYSAGKGSEYQDEATAEFRADKTTAPFMDAAMRMLSALNTDISLSGDGKSLILKRGVTKNPLTISIYGSGIDGIAGKLTNELLGVIYSKMSETMGKPGELLGDVITTKDGKPYGSKQFIEDLTQLTGSQIAFNKFNAKWEAKTGKGKPTEFKSLRDFQLSSRDFEHFKNNMKELFVNQIARGINDDVIGHIADSVDALQTGTNVQSIVAARLFNVKMLEKFAEKQKSGDYVSGEFLSENDMAAVYKEVLKLAPPVSTGSQTFLIGGRENGEPVKSVKTTINGKERTVNVPETYARGADDSSVSPINIFRPTAAGVSGVPIMTIGAGDGNMMQVAATGKNRVTDATFIFDGANMGAKNIDSDGVKFNEAVHKTWANNPIQAVSDSFSAFATANPLAYFANNPLAKNELAELLLDLTKVVDNTGKPKRIISVAEAESLIESTAKSLQDAAVQAQARINALAKFDVSIDQMASAEAPFSKEGSIKLDDGYTDDQLVERVNQEYQAELAKLTEAEALVDQTITDVMDDFSYAEGDVRIATPDSMELLFDNAKTGATKEQATLIKQVAQTLRGNGTRIVFGTKEALNNYAGESLLTDTNNGVYDSRDNIIYVVNTSADTILHELIHAATYQTVDAYLNDPKSVSDATGSAIERIRALMNEWLTYNENTMPTNSNIAYENAYAAVTGYMRDGNMSAAINEFMAYNLSNNALITMGKKMSVMSTLARIATETLEMIKQVIWGDKKAPKVSDDLYSNLRFNTRIVMADFDGSRNSSEFRAYQNNIFGGNDRVTAAMAAFGTKFNSVLNNTPKAYVPSTNAEYTKRYGEAHDIKKALVSSGFDFDMQQENAFGTVAAVTDMYREMNSNVMSKLGDIHTEALNKLIIEDFMADRNTSNPNLIREATEQYNAVMETSPGEFLALSLVNDKFRDVVNKLDLPKSMKDDSGTLDASLDNLGTKAMDGLSAYFDGTGKATTMTGALDAVAAQLSSINNQKTTFIEQTFNGTLDKLDGIIKDNIDALSDRVSGWAGQKTGNKRVDEVKSIINGFAQMINSTTSELAMEGITASLNRTNTPTALMELHSEVVGRTSTNAPIFDMISRVRSLVQQARQQFREILPTQLAKKFSRELTSQEWSDLHAAFGKTSIGVLLNGMLPKAARELLMDKKATDAKLQSLTKAIGTQAGNNSAITMRKADELATYMVTGTQAANMLRNPYAVANLFGEKTNGKPNVTDDYVNNISDYVALKAWSLQDQSTADAVTNLLGKEAEGTEHLLAYLSGSIKEEASKIKTEEAKINHYMGHMPVSTKQGVDLVVVNDSEHNRLRTLGYVRLGDYTGSSADIGRGSMGYYYSPVSGTATYNQGVMQTVRQTAFGVDPDTGYTVGRTAGRITDQAEVKALRSRIANQKTTTEPLQPVYDSTGAVIAYERMMSPDMLAKLNTETNLARTIGQWRGRQIEEYMSQGLNTELLGKLHDMWKDAKRDGRKAEYVNLKTSNDPIHRDTWNVIPTDLKRQIEDVFGDEGLPLRRDMIIDAVGVRSASVGDAWTGKTRLPEVITNRIKDAATILFGENAYKYMTAAEKQVQSFVSDAKLLIVVKSVVVPIANMVSNVYQLLNRGIPLRAILQGIGSKSAELNTYTKNKYKEIELQGELFAARARHDVTGTKRAETALRNINNANRKLSIWPLIEAGEYTAITDGGISQADLALANGKWTNFVEKTAASLPDAAQTPFRYAMVAKDTSLFKGLTKSVQYGDFLAKAILYDHAISKGLSKDEAIGQGAQAFINYNRYAGRMRGYTESIGLVWFWNFKLRIMKETAYLLKNNPARSLLMMAGAPKLPIVGSIGSPLSDNFMTIMANGKLGYSFGPGMGLRAPMMNPWYSLVD